MFCGRILVKYNVLFPCPYAAMHVKFLSLKQLSSGLSASLGDMTLSSFEELLVRCCMPGIFTDMNHQEIL